MTAAAPTKVKAKATAKASSGNPLAAAQAALTGGRREEALSSLLAAWRATRAPEIAALVETLGAQLAPTGVQPYTDPKAKQKDRVAAWVEAARAQNPAILSSLLANLIDGKSGEAGLRLEGLAGWDADPRVASTLAALAEKPPFQAGSTRPFWKRAFQVMREHADPRTRARLAAMQGKYLATLGGAASMAENFEGMARRTVADLDEQLPALTRMLDDGERAAISALEAAIAAAAPLVVKDGRAANADELYAAVYANPDDDGARQVLADVLQELGDPRGEFIALQLSGADAKQEKALYKKHFKEWLGAAGKILKQDSIVFERGFLVEGTIHSRSNGDARNAVGAPEWSTARRLRMNDGPPAFPPTEFETHPVLRGLRVFEGCGLVGGAVIASEGAPRPLEVLKVEKRWNDGLDPNQPLPVDLLRAFREAPTLPQLRVFGITLSDEEVADVATWPLLDRLEELELDDGWAAIVPIQRRSLPRLQRVWLSTGYNANVALTRSDESKRLDELRVTIASPGHWIYASGTLATALNEVRDLLLSRVVLPPAARNDKQFMKALGALDPGEITFDQDQGQDQGRR